MSKLPLCTFAALMIAATAADAAIQVISGSTQATATYARPVEDFSAMSGVGTAVHYDVRPFTVTLPGEYSFVTTATFDAVTFLYAGSFDATRPLLNGLVGNDDLVSATTSGFAYDLTVGTVYFHVVSAFFNGDAGSYSLTVGGPGALAAVPEPAAWVLGSAGLVALLLRRRRWHRGRH